MQALKTITFKHDGKQYVARTYADDSNDAPWEHEEGHGFVRQRRRGETGKRPGERPMGDGWLYDVERTMGLAFANNWGLSIDEHMKLAKKLGRDITNGEKIGRAVELDFENLRAWVRSDWCYIGVSVVRVEPDGTVPDDHYMHAVWGIESNTDYWRDVALELAEECE